MPRPTLPPIQLNIGPRVAFGDQQREGWVRNDLDELRKTLPELATRIEGLPWIKDGIAKGDEYSAFRGLIHLASAGHTARLIEEPWVVEGRNYPALEALLVLAINKPNYLTRVMTHPTISDGISEQEAKLVGSMHPFLGADLLDKLLDPEQVTLEERTITLPQAGETEIAIVRTRPGADHTMDLLERAVRSVGEFMGRPFPKRQMIYLFEETPSGGSAGHNLGNVITLLIDEQTLSGELLLALLAHETSHHYWTGVTPTWIKEGAATFLEAIAKGEPQGPLDWSPCAVVGSIAELEELERDPSAPRESRLCHYSLGERLFHDLYRNMDDTAFRLAFRRLYLHTVYEIADECRNANGWANICDVKEAFTAYASDETAAAVEKVIARWYDGTQPYDLSSIDDTPSKAEIAAINGRIESAYLSFSEGGSPVSAVAVGSNRELALFLNLDYSYGNSNGLRSLPIEIALYFEDGFEYRRIQQELPLPSNATRQTHSFFIPPHSATGRYWVQAYWEEQKIAEATFEAVPDSDAHSMRGRVTDPDGNPPGTAALRTRVGGVYFQANTEPNGAFTIVVPSGSFILDVLVLVGSEYVFVGWYDGKGSITTDPNQAFQVVVSGTDIEGINIRLPTDTEGLLCPTGSFRSSRTGNCVPL